MAFEENFGVERTDDGKFTISGSVEHVIFSNEENGYAICAFVTDDGDDITIVGTLPYISDGAHISVTGAWVHNPKYGRQFRVDSYEAQLPSDVDSILRYLASGAIHGVRVKTAIKIVEQFGEDTFDVIENHPEWLAQINGISRKKAFEISESFKAESGMRTTMLFFREYFGPATTVKIFKKWGSSSVELAKRNPYILCEHIDGIGFEKADAMAAKLSVSPESAERIKSGMLYLLSHNANQSGHTCLPKDKLIEGTAEMLSVKPDKAEEAFHALISLGKIKYSVFDGKTYCYESSLYEAESFVARKLDMINKLCPQTGHEDIDAFIMREQLNSGIEYAPLQKAAIKEALQSGVMILTGGPGTGKTTVVRALMNIFRSMGMEVALAAPTGRAAKRMSESTSSEAKTIHRLLEVEYGDGDSPIFLRDEKNYLDESVIIVDEASMIDIRLAAALMRAVKPGARVILIGDADQLPSVGCGNVLRDLIASEHFATIRLNVIFRQAQKSLIVTNSHAINDGICPDLGVKDNDFFFLSREGNREIAATIADLYKNRLPRTYGADTVNKIQVISPSRKGEAGTENLNVILQKTLNPPEDGKIEYRTRQLVFRVGDRVMQIKNNYEIEWTQGSREGVGIFNGDIGTIREINKDEQYMLILFDDKEVIYDFSMLEDIEHAYAITVHKSQGSEYPIVIMPIYSCPPMLMTRNLLYTAVTRAQNMVILVGREEYVSRMVENNRQSMRYTCLDKRLRGE